MKRFVTMFLAPLLVMALMSFTPPGEQQHQIRGSDSTTVNVVFSPAKLVVDDNRNVVDMSTLIKENSESNIEFAVALERVAEVIDRGLNLQERRCASYMDRITSQTGLSIDKVNQIIHKKRVYDITFYTLFVLYIIYVFQGLAQMSSHASVVSYHQIMTKTILGIISIALLYLMYLAVGVILNGPHYHLIHSIINSPPG